MPNLNRDELAAQVTEIAYQALLRQGLQQPFLEVELDLWRQIRSVLRRRPAGLETAGHTGRRERVKGVA